MSDADCVGQEVRVSTFIKKVFQVILIGFLATTSVCHAKELAITFDDAPTPDSALMTGHERTQKIIATLQKAKVPDALFFVQADRLNKTTQSRLDQYAAAGFHIANHSYSHQSASALGKDNYIADVKSAHLLLKNQKNFLPFHRFPYLDCGKGKSSILAIRDSLAELGYKDGYITIAHYDWHISNLLATAAENKKNINYEKAKQFYVNTLFSAIEFYDQVAIKTLGKSPKHVLLLHENDAAALFLGDLIAHLRSKGWNIITPQQAYEDPISRDLSNIAYHHQNRVAAIARKSGVPEYKLYHESENVAYLDAAFEAAGIIF
jgi:peptidoglycan/xylan/chitin deacetylase (PgdA/CDA1 family)